MNNSGTVRYTILGERCSGTNYLEKLMGDNFNCTIDWINGWKHFFAYKGYDDKVKHYSDVIFLGIVRNPIDYLMSFYKNPHHQSVERKKDIESFLLSEFYSIWTVSDEIMEDRKSDGTRYKNIFELRSIKCRYLYDVMPSLANKYYFIRYEDLKNEPANILSKIKDRFNLKTLNKEYYIETKYVHQNKTIENRVCKENYDVADDVKKLIYDNLDFEIEKRMQYISL